MKVQTWFRVVTADDKPVITNVVTEILDEMPCISLFPFTAERKFFGHDPAEMLFRREDVANAVATVIGGTVVPVRVGMPCLWPDLAENEL